MRTLGLLLTFAYLALGTVSASAQIELKVTLPFAFQAVDTKFDAGMYRIEVSVRSSHIDN